MELKLPEQIDVIDITMRDGLQNEEHYVPLEAKLYLADRLIKAGFKRLEVGSISHVAYVPQFKDVDELLLKLPKDVDVEYTVLALTPKAIERRPPGAGRRWRRTAQSAGCPGGSSPTGRPGATSPRR